MTKPMLEIQECLNLEIGLDIECRFGIFRQVVNSIQEVSDAKG